VAEIRKEGALKNQMLGGIGAKKHSLKERVFLETNGLGHRHSHLRRSPKEGERIREIFTGILEEQSPDTRTEVSVGGKKTGA